MAAVLGSARGPLPVWKLARTTSVIDCFAVGQRADAAVEVVAAGASTAPAAMEQVEPDFVEAIDITFSPVSPTGK